MLSNQQIKYFKSLQQKKFRDQHEVFVAEGHKLIKDLLDSNLECLNLFKTDDEIIDHGELISKKEMERITGLKSASNSYAVFKKRSNKVSDLSSSLVLLDGIQDPGNMGTIIRLADWFGYKHIICSKNTVDCYNPKVIQSTMGSIRNVEIIYLDLVDFVNQHKGNYSFYGAFMEGANLKEINRTEQIGIILGNEGKGVSPELGSLIDQKVSIPASAESKAESLNVATAGAIFLHHFSA